MAAPKPSNKTANMGKGKTAAIQASRDRTKAQTAPGTDYKAEQAEKKSSGGGGYYAGSSRAAKAEERKKKSKERIASIKAMTDRLRSSRKAMASKMNPFQKE